MSIYVLKSSAPLTLDIQFQTNTASPNDTVHVNKRNQNKNNTKSGHIQIDHVSYCSI